MAPFHFRHRFALLALSLLPLSSIHAQAEITPALPLLSPVFGDHMVLQRGKTNTFWGWSSAGASVRIVLGDQSAETRAGTDGRWELRLDPPKTPGPHALIVNGPVRIEIKDVLVGDVWLCGGQSNMDFPLAGALNGDVEVAKADHAAIRFFKEPQRAAYSPAHTPQGAWKVCTPAHVSESGFSAVAYYFARRIQAETGVPIGIIQAAVGGSPAESWISASALRRLGDFDDALDEIAELRASGGSEYGNYISHWYERYDPGSRAPAWSDAAFDDARWTNVTVPGVFDELGPREVPALVWLRGEITLPDPLPPGPARLRLGSIEQMDTAWLNGRWIGASAWVENPRVYPVSPGVLKPGKNKIALRIFKLKSPDAFLSPPETLQLELSDGTRVPLAGAQWKAAVGVDARKPHPLPRSFENWPVMPAVLSQGMLHPFAPLSLTGALWYQGEANASRAWQYRRLLPALITDWRELFHQNDLPFYVVGLPAFTPRCDQPGDSDWAELREAQALAVHTTPHTGLAVTIDSGEAGDIHPKDKKIVGERLALLALADVYGKNVIARGPALERVEKLPGALRLHFSHADGGLVLRENPSPAFAVAGDDRAWHWANATIDGDTLVVSSPDVPAPVAVRYAWQSNPPATLFNGAAIPAGPFRTDDWPGITKK